MSKEYPQTSKVRILDGKCSICPNTFNLQIHHLSYEPEIFVILCKSCHEKLHNHGCGRPQCFINQCQSFIKNVYCNKRNNYYGYEDFRNDHKEEIETIGKYYEIVVSFPRDKLIGCLCQMQDIWLDRKGKSMLKPIISILYEFGQIEESKENVKENWKNFKSIVLCFEDLIIESAMNKNINLLDKE